jgi:hypothetical protein
MSDDDLSKFTDPDLVNLDDYDASSDDPVDDDPNRINITESDGPNLEEGDDLDTGAAIR